MIMFKKISESNNRLKRDKSKRNKSNAKMSGQLSENDVKGVCLSWFGKNKTLDENCKSLLDMQFAKFTSFANSRRSTC